MKSTISANRQDTGRIKTYLMKRNKVESAMKVIVSACDEAASAYIAGMDMAWYEANIAFAVLSAMKALGLHQTISRPPPKHTRTQHHRKR